MPTGYTTHGKKLKIGTEVGNLKPFVVWKKYNEDKIQQKPTVCNNYAIKNYCHSSQTNRTIESTENWCVDGLISFEESFCGLEELSFNPVSYSAKTNHVQ